MRYNEVKSKLDELCSVGDLAIDWNLTYGKEYRLENWYLYIIDKEFIRVYKQYDLFTSEYLSNIADIILEDLGPLKIMIIRLSNIVYRLYSNGEVESIW